MASPIYLGGLNWTGQAYAAAALPEGGLPVGDPESSLWGTWFNTFNRAKRGDFTGVRDLVTVHQKTGNWILRSMCADLLGDAGTQESFRTVMESLDTADNIVAKIDFCEVLAWWGQLSIVPFVLETFHSVQHFNDADILPVQLSDLLEAEAGLISDSMSFATPSEYSEFVITRYQELRNQLGSDQVIVFNGQRFSVISLAKIILSALADDSFDFPLRRKFEASTGLDCSGFYDERGNLQPLSAAAIVEDFLGSPEAVKYEDGVRYFFGHRIPD